MKKSLINYWVVKPLLLMALSFFLTTACYSSAIHESTISTNHAPDCEVIQHKLGEICIPFEPKRIIALDPGIIADPLLALGIRPVGIATFSNLQGKEDLAGLTSDEVEGIARVGDVIKPSLERILKLKPDLILGMYFHEQVYEQLSAIAPTILVEEQKDEPIKKYLRYLAQVLNKEVEAERVLSQYQNQIKKIRGKLNRQPKEIEVTVLVYYSGSFYLSRTEDSPHQIFSDIGLTDNISETFSPISIETIDKYDADILFIMDYDAKPTSFFLQNALIASLNAVKNNRAYVIEAEKWHSGGILGLNKMPGDLEKYLIEEKGE